MRTKALARLIYAHVPGTAAARFAIKDLISPYTSKAEYDGVSHLSVGDGLIVDVGANRGQSIDAFKRLAPGAKIIAFEPDPRQSARLKARQNQAVKTFDCALAADSGATTFYVPTYGRWDCDGRSAMSRDTATDWLKDPGQMFSFDERKLRVKEHDVEIKTLDSFNLAPALIKLHAQGAEPEILKGAMATIRRHSPALMCAFAAGQVTDMLADVGYRPYTYDDGQFVEGVAHPHITFTWFFRDQTAPVPPLIKGPEVLVGVAAK